MPKNSFYTYLADGVTFRSTKAVAIKNIYAPLCGIDASGLKSSITPGLSGDIKLDKTHYVTKPASREDLRGVMRNFFAWVKGRGVISLTSSEEDVSSSVEVGQVWHKITRRYLRVGLEMTAINVIPATNETLELMQVTVKNISKKTLSVTPTAAVPLFGRAMANKHDHEHVTSLLNRVQQLPQGVLLEPTMSFNEEGHQHSSDVYFVFGREGQGRGIAGSFPTTDSFYGDQGNLDKPLAVMKNCRPIKLTAKSMQGKEVVGALRFKDVILKSGESHVYIVAIGIATDSLQAQGMFARFDTLKKFNKALEGNQHYWAQKNASIQFKTGKEDVNAWLRWVIIQPVLRRIFGCSFLPDHDYGKGGKGWRDIWQDLLSLILIEPSMVRQDLINNCAGIRIDGSNATIIGSKPSEFIADRNAITRVWMDHGAWPLLTLLLYIDQTGDFDILLEQQTYFRDPQMSRTFDKDLGWVSAYGHKLLDKKGQVAQGTIIEHILVQTLTQFYNVGEHNIIRLESADWNDGLDMAFERGESVAFTSFYGGNCLKIADLLEDLAVHKKITYLALAKELLILLDTLSGKINYDDHHAKHNVLFGKYFHSVQPATSGDVVEVEVKLLARDLRAKGRWIFAHLKNQEMVSVIDAGKTYHWFNGYYDNRGQRVEGKNKAGVRMTLTGQVFALMSGVVEEKDVLKVVASVDHFLKDKHLGGIRLNTDFGVRHYLDFGRAFGFAYGTKENGAFFSHMTVMYAYALYHRGYARAGHAVLRSIYAMVVDAKRSKIYPGIPEYFDGEGRGMYHYLTGSASWLVLTELVEVFGVRGYRGDLVLAPQLVKEEFNRKGIAQVACQFAGHQITVIYQNPQELDAGTYQIKAVSLNGEPVQADLFGKGVLIKRGLIFKGMILNVLLGK